MADNSARLCVRASYWDTNVGDSVWVDSNCMVTVRPEYWGTGINTQISEFYCKSDVDARKRLEGQYLDNIRDLNTMYTKEAERYTNCQARISLKDSVIMGKDSILAIKDSIRSELKGQLKDTQQVLSYWMATAIGLFLVAVVEGVSIYLLAK